MLNSRTRKHPQLIGPNLSRRRSQDIQDHTGQKITPTSSMNKQLQIREPPQQAISRLEYTWEKVAMPQLYPNKSLRLLRTGTISGKGTPALGKRKRVPNPVIDNPTNIGGTGFIKSPEMMPLDPTPLAWAIPSIPAAPPSSK